MTEMNGEKGRKKQFPYGNYDRYYGYRNGSEEDPRILVMEEKWFKDKQVLDVGCNVGHVTILIAKKFSPRHILGIDIDKGLILRASRSLLRCEHVPGFPGNISFAYQNYVPTREHMPEEQYDTIVALSVTKWIHLVNGDKGLKRVFRRMHGELREGGVLLLEVQDWESYGKKRNSSVMAARNYSRLKLRPCDFREFLTERVGFTFMKDVFPRNGSSEGFSRPISVFRK